MTDPAPIARKRERDEAAVVYHPDPEINAEIAQEALEAERFDLAVGYLPRRWQCECGASHGRGHFMSIGVHRCLGCGYVGTGGVMFGTSNPVPPTERDGCVRDNSVRCSSPDYCREHGCQL